MTLRQRRSPHAPPQEEEEKEEEEKEEEEKEEEFINLFGVSAEELHCDKCVSPYNLNPMEDIQKIE